MFDCRHQPLRLPDELAAQLAAAYSEPHRAYHNLSHIAEVLGWYDRVADDVGWHQPAEVYVAIVFHDAIYQPAAKDNEARSADWAKQSGVPVELGRVGELIEYTGRHGLIGNLDHDMSLFLDCDMSILGSPPERFDAYDRAIALEYQHVPAEAFREGRRHFLTGLAQKRRIFLSDYFHAELDAQARANLAQALARA